MSLEAITAVEKAETEAARVKAEAAVEAKRIVAAAETAGREAIEAARRKAEEERKLLNTQAAEKAAAALAALQGSMDNEKAALRARAESRLDKAAEIIVERIVNS